MSNFTLFSSDPSSSSGGSADYVKDVFEDVSVPATTNLGFTSTSLTNPQGQFFANDDAPKYGLKTLFIKDLVLLKDRSKWVDNKPTYLVEFQDSYPGIYAYIWGNVRLRNQANGLCVDIKNQGDGFGITGIVREVCWGVNSSIQATATASLYTDGVDTTSDINFGAAASDSQNLSVNKYLFIKHGSGLETQNIHDFRLIANEYATLSVFGVQVYFENANANIQQAYGTTYIDKFKSTTTTAVGLTLPTLTGKLGAKTLIYKTQSNTYATDTVETPYIATVATGSSGTNLVNVTTGQGASFPAGIGLVGVNGSSYYIGSVVSVSTDTLTVTPTLGFGFSGLLYKAWEGGPTFSIGASIYQLKHSIDIQTQRNYLDPNGFGVTLSNDFYYSDPNFSYRIWGDQLQSTVIEGYPGVGFNGNTTGFFQVEGNYSAVEIEVVGNGIFNGTFCINGAASFGVNEGFTGIVRKTIAAAGGPSWNTWRFSPGQSLINWSIYKVNLYERNNTGQSLGLLSSFENSLDKAYQYTHNASLVSLGPWQRVYADQLFLSGNWIRGTTHSQPGGVFYTGATNACVAKINYFGDDFCFIGSLGASHVMLLDGASIGILANTVKQVSGTTFHTLEYQHKGDTSIIAAIDFARPSVSEFTSLQNYLPREELEPENLVQAYYQSDTPRDARNGALWTKDPNNGPFFVKLGNRWLQVSAAATYDDPNGTDLIFIKSHGVSTPNDNTSVTGTTESFNFISWSTVSADSVLKSGGGIGDMGLSDVFYYIDGYASGSASAVLANRKFNKTSWSSSTNRVDAKVQFSQAALSISQMVFAGGSLPTGTIEIFSGSSWTNGPTVASGQTNDYARGAFKQGSLVHFLGGYDGVLRAAHDTFDGSSASTATDVPASSVWTAGSQIGGKGHITGAAANTTDGYTWDGASWSGALTATYGPNYANGGAADASLPASGYNPNNQTAYVTNGASNATTAITTSMQFNGTSYSAGVSSSTARAGVSGGVA